MILRPALAVDAAALSELAGRSKGHWGYDAAFLEACRQELKLDPDEVTRTHRRCGRGRHRSRVLQLGWGSTAGRARLPVRRACVIGRGVGRLLWDHMDSSARQLGFESIRIEADPSAWPFYEAMGAEQIGSVPSGSIPGRRLPLLVYRFAR